MHRSSDHFSQSASGPAASPAARRGKRRWVATATLLIAPLLGVSSACLDRPIGRPEPVTTNIFVDQITQTSVDKIDLLFMIDNSISMADKQAILADAVPLLVTRLITPICVDGDGSAAQHDSQTGKASSQQRPGAAGGLARLTLQHHWKNSLSGPTTAR